MMYKMSFIELANEGERLCKSGDCSQGIKYFEAALQLYEQQQKSEQQQLEEQSEATESEQHRAKMLQTVAIIYNQLGNAYFNLQDYNHALEFHKKDLELSEQFGDESGKAKACGNVGNTLQLLGDYDEAIYYLLRNLEISKKLNDVLRDAEECENVTNTLLLLEYCDEAIYYLQRFSKILKKLNEVSGEARALYNLANIYQAKGKFMGRLTYSEQSGEPNSGEFAHEIREVLQKAVHYYNETLRLVANKERSAEGRTYGNLGNTHYLLGDFDAAIFCHLERLKIAREFGDKAAERRAYSNLGNAHIFQGKFVEAAEYYLKAMNVARSLGDKAIEAQSYYSLGNAYTLLQDYALSIDFHHRHLLIAQTLDDKIGECRAYWSLGNSYAAMGDLENAINYANMHLNLAKHIGDSTSELTAKKNLYDFQNLLTSSGFRDSESGLFTPICSKYGRKYLDKSMGTMQKSASIDSFYTNVTFNQPQVPNGNGMAYIATPSMGSAPFRPLNNKPISQGDLTAAMMMMKPPAAAATFLPPETSNKTHHSLTDIENKSLDAVNNAQHHYQVHNHNVSSISAPTAKAGGKTIDPDLSFLEQITRMQSKRLDDQRCVLKPTATVSKKTNTKAAASTIPNEDFFDLIIKSQRTRLEDQRSSFNTRRAAARLGGNNAVANGSVTSSSANGTTTNGNGTLSTTSNTNLSTTTSTSSSATDLNSHPRTTTNNISSKTYTKQSSKPSNHKSPIAASANNDLFQLIERVQSRRFDEQRAAVKPNTSSLFRFGRKS